MKLTNISTEELLAEIALRRGVQFEVECTGLTASWCPICGDCCCRNREDSMSDDDCPLHAAGTPHPHAHLKEFANNV